MPPHPTRAPRLLSLAAMLAALIAATTPAHALRVVNYNITNYPGVLFPQRQPHFRTVLTPLGADVVVVQEIQSQVGVDSFRVNVLNVLEPGQWESAPFTNGSDTDNGLFYKPSKVQFLGQRSFYVSIDATRLVNEYRLKPVGYVAGAAELRLYSVHLKASNTSSDAQQRLREATGLRDTMNALPAGTHAIVLGDFNIYSGLEAAFTKFLESQANDVGRLYDPLNAPLITWNTASLSTIHTQCPCGDNPSPSRGCPSGGGFSGGGLDDRFDMFLPTYPMADGEGLELLPATYLPVGNDGLHYNVPITDNPVLPEGAAYATALINASDHLPIRVDLQLPAQCGAPGSLAFGSVLVGAAATLNLGVTNIAPAPADTLEYSLAPPAGFGAPGGSFTALAGGGPSLHEISLDTSSPGLRAGFLQVLSNDLDTPARNVAATGTVLDHAQPSLDAATVVQAAFLDFGTHDAGGFSDQVVSVHNVDFGPLRARLQLTGTAIAGAAGRFSLVPPGFSPVLVDGSPQTYALRFDAAGATQDSAYTATLTITSTDEALPGGTARPDLVVTLQATVSGGATDVLPGSPTATSFLGARPNPAMGRTTLSFDLSRPGLVTLELFDLRGANVRSVVDGWLEPGRHHYTWEGADSQGQPLPAGIYFVRFVTPGLATTRRLVLLR
jgi:hypothetical protein